MPTLILLRHGATVWGEENRFAGWADTPLSATGAAEAERAGQILQRAGSDLDLCLTSRLLRAEQSLAAVRSALGLPESKVVRDWRLNERHYGALQGETRSAMIDKYGNAQVVAWRRSYTERPPLLGDDDPRWHEQLVRLADVPAALQPRGESLRDAVDRVTPVWFESMVPALRAGGNVLVVAHTSTIRALVRAIEGLNDEQSASFRIATAIPRVYELAGDLSVVTCVDLAEGVNSRLRYWANRLKPRRLGGV